MKKIKISLTGKIYQNIEYFYDDYKIIKNENEQLFYNYADLNTSPYLEKGFLSDKICFYYDNKKIILNNVSKFLNKKNFEYILHYYIPYFKKNIENCIHLIDKYCINNYLNDSNFKILNQLINYIKTSYLNNKYFYDNNLNNQYIDNLNYLLSFLPFEDNLEKIRENFEINELNKYKHFFNTVESNPLTKEQSLAIIRDNDLNLVLAAAGTGKTSVIIGKIIYSLIKQKASQDEILVLAFAKDAAQELNNRIAKTILKLSKIYPELESSNKIEATTFHSMGLNILKKSKKQTFLSKFAENENLKLLWIQDRIKSYLNENESLHNSFMSILYPISNPLSFETKEDYEKFLCDNEYITLNNDKVRSYQELLIGNWLYINQIRYEYEANYTIKTRIEIGYDYKPDFYLPDYDIYIEHYGIDRKGNTRAGIDKIIYNKQILSKRELHYKNQTKLLETYHYEWCENVLFENLKLKLEQYGVIFNPISKEQLFEQLDKLNFISKMAKIMNQSLEALKIEGINIEEAKKRLNNSKYNNVENFINLLNTLKNDYENELQSKKEIDFNDMILQARDCVLNNEFSPKWKYILIDEFQDISQTRFNLVKSLLEKVNASKLFAVGDDWQSIYRFSGGKLELTTRFEKIIGNHTITKLQKTFRYNNSIADVAGEFIMKNPEQYKKYIDTHEKVDSSQVFLIDECINNQDKYLKNSKLISILSKISKNDSKGTIAILSRYNSLLKKSKEEISAYNFGNKINYWTFHKSKGLEADYCILLGFKQGILGFPSDNKDFEAVEALLPSVDGFPYSEERRLMYVALTRAKKKIYILADSITPSPFVNELILSNKSIILDSERFQAFYKQVFKCDNCEKGYLIKKIYQSNSYYQCNFQPACNTTLKSCTICDSPMLDNNFYRICKNPDCKNKVKLCQKCFRPMYIRKGTYGDFYGCSGYGLKGKDKCSNTEKINKF